MNVETLRKRRTDVDFSKHVLTETKTDQILIYKFAIPDTIYRSVIFINAAGIMAVTGDYGNWVFCREFHASADGHVSDSYWCEKVRIASTQEPSLYDPKETRKEIRKRLAEEDLDEEDRKYLESLFNYVDEGEMRYLVSAHDLLPSNRDHEFVPYVKSLNYWLEVIFDAFDEICRLKEPT